MADFVNITNKKRTLKILDDNNNLVESLNVELSFDNPNGTKLDAGNLNTKVDKATFFDENDGSYKNKTLSEQDYTTAHSNFVKELIRVDILKGGKLNSELLPPLAISSITIYNDVSELPISGVEEGDVAMVKSNKTTYFYDDVSGWVQILTPDCPVQSVNGYTGHIILGRSDFDLENVNNTSDRDKPVSDKMKIALDAKADIGHKHSICQINDLFKVVEKVNASLEPKDILEGANIKIFADNFNKKVTVHALTGDKLDKYQGVENQGKILGIGPDGNLSAFDKFKINNIYVAKNETEMLSFDDAVRGDVVIRTDEKQSYILTGDNYDDLGSWHILYSNLGPIHSGCNEIGLKAIEIKESDWQTNGEQGFIIEIPAEQHNMGATNELIVEQRILCNNLTSNFQIVDNPEVTEIGTVILRSDYQWKGLCLIFGGNISLAKYPTKTEINELFAGITEPHDNLKSIFIHSGEWQGAAGTGYTIVIPASEHEMGETNTLIVQQKMLVDSNGSMVAIANNPEISIDGTITLRSDSPWDGVCVITGRVMQITDPEAMREILYLNINKADKNLNNISDIDFATKGQAAGLANIYHLTDSAAHADIRTDISIETNRSKTAELALSQRISAQEGIGGALTAYNFGTATPLQQALTQYALSQIPSISNPLDIWNSTHVTNLFDNNTWQLNNTQNTNPAVFEWVSIGNAMISQFANGIAGIIKGSNENGKIKALSDGTGQVNGFDDKVNKAQGILNANKFLGTDGSGDVIVKDINIPMPILYPAKGQNTDGAMTQKAVTDELAAKLDITSASNYQYKGDAFYTAAAGFNGLTQLSLTTIPLQNDYKYCFFGYSGYTAGMITVSGGYWEGEDGNYISNCVIIPEYTGSMMGSTRRFIFITSTGIYRYRLPTTSSQATLSISNPNCYAYSSVKLYNYVPS